MNSKIFLGLLVMHLFIEQPMLNEGTLIGKVGVYEGNCMPAPGAPPCKPRPLSALIYISVPSESFNREYLVDSVRSDNGGQFSLQLEAGDYSIFVKDGSQITCTVTSCPSECYCLPVSVFADSTTEVEVMLDHAVW